MYDTAKCSLCTGYYCWHWAREGRGWRPIWPHVCRSTHLSAPAHFLLWPHECCVCQAAPTATFPLPPSSPGKCCSCFLRGLGYSFPFASPSHFCINFCLSFKACACATTSGQPMHVSTWKACAQYQGEENAKRATPSINLQRLCHLVQYLDDPTGGCLETNSLGNVLPSL